MTQCSASGVGAVFAECEVVLGRTTVVAVSADDDLDGGMSIEIRSGLCGGCDGIGAQIVAVVVEEGRPERSGGRQPRCPYLCQSVQGRWGRQERGQ